MIILTLLSDVLIICVSVLVYSAFGRGLFLKGQYTLSCQCISLECPIVFCRGRQLQINTLAIHIVHSP